MITLKLKKIDKLWKNMVELIDWLDKQGHTWKICIEWPRNCAYWRLSKVLQFCQKWNLGEALFDGCAFGVKARNGLLLMKPWRVVTNDPCVMRLLGTYRCTNLRLDGLSNEHGECRGVDCKLSENYSWKMIITIHKAFRESVLKSREGDRSIVGSVFSSS